MTYMANAEREPIAGFWGWSPHRDPGARGKAPLLLELKTFQRFDAKRKQQIRPIRRISQIGE